MFERIRDPWSRLRPRERDRQRDVAAHRPLLRPERAPAGFDELLLVRLGELDADVRTEQPHEHVAVHERAEVAEHRLDLDARIVGHQGLEARLVGVCGLGDLHLYRPSESLAEPSLERSVWMIGQTAAAVIAPRPVVALAHATPASPKTPPASPRSKPGTSPKPAANPAVKSSLGNVFDERQ